MIIVSTTASWLIRTERNGDMYVPVGAMQWQAIQRGFIHRKNVLKNLKEREMTNIENKALEYAGHNCNKASDEYVAAKNAFEEGADYAIERALEWMREQVYQEYGGGPLEKLVPEERIADFLETIYK